jgi:hypothetical protein
MFTTTNAKKIYVPIELRAKLYTYGNNSPRARRCVTSVRQLVHHGGGKEVDTKTACFGLAPGAVIQDPRINRFKIAGREFSRHWRISLQKTSQNRQNIGQIGSRKT